MAAPVEQCFTFIFERFGRSPPGREARRLRKALDLKHRPLDDDAKL